MKLLKLLLFLILSVVGTSATTLTGTVKLPDGTLVNGTMTFTASQVLSLNSTGGCGGPLLVVPNRPVTLTLTNGVPKTASGGTPTIYGNDCVTPTQTYYIVTVRDGTGLLLFSDTWSITGSTLDVGTVPSVAVPTGQTIFNNLVVTNLTVLGSFSPGVNLTLTEGTCVGLAASDTLCASSSSHSFKSSLNNGTFVEIPQIAGDFGGTAASPTVAKIQGTTVTGTTGTGNSVFSINPLITGGATINGGLTLDTRLAKSNTLTTTDYTDQANTHGAFLQKYQAGSNFQLTDTTDLTKIAQFDLSNITTGTTRTITVANTASTTVIPLTCTNQFFSALSSVGVLTCSTVAFSQLSGSVAASQMPALTGDVTTSAGAVATTIANSAVTNAKIANMAANTVKANFTGSSTAPTDFAMPSCSDSSGNHLNYVSGTGVTCGTTLTAHNLLSATHGDTTTHTVVRGDLIAGIGASPTWTAVAKGGTNTYPKWNSSGDVVASTNAASGTGTPTACSNQAVTSFTLSADAVPTSICTTITSSFVDTSILSTSGTQSPTNKNLTSATSGNTVTLLNVQNNLSAIVGTAADANIFTWAIPANIVASGKAVRIKFWFSHSTGTAAVNYRFKIGSTTISNYGSPAGTGTFQGEITLHNQGSGLCTKIDDPLITSTPSIQSAPGYGAGNTCDFSAGFTVNLTFNVANTDQVTPQYWIAELIQ